MGLYAIYISDSSDSSITSTSEDEEEDYQSTTNKTSDQGNSFLSKFRVHATIYIDVKYFFVASTHNFNLSEYIITASELWATSPSTSSIYSSTSQYSDEPLPSYSQLLDYSPSSICDAAQVWGRPKATEHTKECLLPRRPGC